MIDAILPSQPAHNELTFPLTFKWEKQNNSPCGENSGYLCTINGKVYITTTGIFRIKKMDENFHVKVGMLI